MITVEFPGRAKRYGGTALNRKVWAIIIDEPLNSISGIVECCDCEWKSVITTEDTDGQVEEIEIFACNHLCERLPTKQELLDAIAKAKQERG